MSEASKVVCIVGPTASGKSSLAEAVALRLKSAVVSVDAMQVYRGMDVGTAKTPAGERRCPLLMVDVCDPTESYSVQRFQADARSCADGSFCAVSHRRGIHFSRQFPPGSIVKTMGMGAKDRQNRPE